MYFFPFSNQSKEAFIDWARYDDSQDHFCELDGKMFKLFQSLFYLLSLKKHKGLQFLCKPPFKKSFNFVLNGEVTVHIVSHAKNVIFYKDHLVVYTVCTHCYLLLV